MLPTAQLEGTLLRLASSGICAASLLVACGGPREHAPAANVLPPPLFRTAESRQDIAAMLTEAMASEACDQLRGRFLPIAYTKNGAAPRGDEPVGGRWWVRECRAQVYGAQTALYLAGPGWAWAEGSKALWGTAEYVYFTGGGSVVGLVDAGFDQGTHTAWLQFRPTVAPYTDTRMSNRLEAHGDIFGKAFSIVTLGLLSESIDDKANDAARDIIAAAFKRQIGSGFVLRFDLWRRQRDVFAFGQAAPPLRPFDDGIRWLVNEQQVLHSNAGGVHLNGPFAPTQAAGVDFAVLAGALRYRAECERDVAAWFEPVSRGQAPTLPPPQHAQAGMIVAASLTHRTIATQCPWYLLTEAAADTVIANVRVRADTSQYPLPGP